MPSARPKSSRSLDHPTIPPSTRRGRCRHCLRRWLALKIHLRNISCAFCGFEVSVVLLVSGKSGNQIVRKLQQVSVVVLDRVVIALALDGDAVFGARQFVLQAQEIFIGLEAADSSPPSPTAARSLRRVAGWRRSCRRGCRRESSAERALAISPKTVCSCCANPFTVSTRFGIRSARRCSTMSTCDHAAFTA